MLRRSRLPLLCLVPLMCVASAPFAQAAEPATQPVVELCIPSGGLLLQHWNAAPIGKAWADPGVTPLRERVDREISTLSGCDIFAALADSSEIRVMVTSIDGSIEEPHIHYQAQVRFATSAPQIFALLAGHGRTDTVAQANNADEAVLLGDENPVRLVRRGEWLLVAPATDPVPVPVTSTADKHDLSGLIDGPRIANWIVAHHPLPTPGPSEAQVRSLLPLTAGQVNFTPAGGVSTIEIHTPATWLTPINPAALGRMPGHLLDVTAIGLDGQALWKEAEPVIAQLIAANTTESEPDPLKAAGITSTWKDLVTALHGTWILAISPGMPMPGYNLIGPRSAALDELMEILAQRFDGELAAQGAYVTLMPQGSPFTLTLARTADQWLVSSDPNFAATWVITDTDGGWATSSLGTIAAKKISDGGCMLMIGDTQAQVRSLAPLISVGFAAMPRVIVTPAEKQAAMKFINRLAAIVTPGWSVVRHRGKIVEITGEGIFSTGGSVPVVAVLAGMLLPAINLVRETARKKNSSSNVRQLILGSVVWSNDNDQQ